MEATVTTSSSPFLRRAIAAYASAARMVDTLQPLFALALRLHIARVFVTSGVIKLGNWEATLGLFRNEYHVPLLPPALAAVTGTAAELALPVFLLLGLGTRAAAIALFVFNAVAATSYPDLSVAGLKDHILWGSLLLVTICYGPGGISVDHWLARRFGV